MNRPKTAPQDQKTGTASLIQSRKNVRKSKCNCNARWIWSCAKIWTTPRSSDGKPSSSAYLIRNPLPELRSQTSQYHKRTQQVVPSNYLSSQIGLHNATDS